MGVPDWVREYVQFLVRLVPLCLRRGTLAEPPKHRLDVWRTKIHAWYAVSGMWIEASLSAQVPLYTASMLLPCTLTIKQPRFIFKPGHTWIITNNTIQ